MEFVPLFHYVTILESICSPFKYEDYLQVTTVNDEAKRYQIIKYNKLHLSVAQSFSMIDDIVIFNMGYYAFKSINHLNGTAKKKG